MRIDSDYKYQEDADNQNMKSIKNINKEDLSDLNYHAIKKGKMNLNKNSVYYGVNIDISKYPELYNDLESCINPIINFGSTYDSLSYVREHIPGMTIPQMYIKVPNVWTGGHEENLRMRSVNINHGPGNSFWWTSPYEDSDKIFTNVKENYGINIFKKEGVYFPHFDFFLMNNIRVIYTLQKEGDIILVGSGSIHW